MKKSILGVLVVLFISTLACAGDHRNKDPFIGSYTQDPAANADYTDYKDKLQIWPLQKEDRNPKDVAAAAKAEGVPLSDLDGFIELPIPNLYFVKLQVSPPAASDASDCEVSTEFKRQGNQLIYDQQGCRIVISKNAKGEVSVSTFRCSACDPGVSVSPKPFDYDESSPLDPINRQDEGDSWDGY